MKRSRLEEAAQELNFFLDLEPRINVKAQMKELKSKVYEAACLLVEGEQELSLSMQEDRDQDTEERIKRIQNTFVELKVPLFMEDGSEAEVETPEHETTDEVEGVRQSPECPEESDVDNVDNEEQIQTPTLSGSKMLPPPSLIKVVEKTKKLADLKALVMEHEEFALLREQLSSYAGLSGVRQIKTDMLSELGEAEGKQTPPPKEEKKTGPVKEREDRVHRERAKKYTRQDSVIEAIRALCKTGVTSTDITVLSHDLYVKNGGKRLRKLQHMSNVVGHTLRALTAFGILIRKGRLYQFSPEASSSEGT